MAYNIAQDITKHDTVDIPMGLTDAVYVGGAGVVAAVFQGGAVSNFTATAGEILPLKVKRVNSTSTTATLMVALYNQ